MCHKSCSHKVKVLPTFQTQSFFALAKSLPTITAIPDITAALDSLDDHLGFRTYLVGHDITAADFIVWGTLKGTKSWKFISIITNALTCAVL